MQWPHPSSVEASASSGSRTAFEARARLERARCAARGPGPGDSRRSWRAGRPAAGPPSRITATSLAEHLLGLVGVGGGGRPVMLARADRQRAGALEDLERDLVVGHPHRDRAPGVAEVPLQRGLLAETSVSGPGQKCSTSARA